MIRLAILGSTRGTGMLPILDAIEAQRLSASVEIVISNKEDAMILSRAQSHGVPAVHLDARDLTREQYDAKLSALLREHRIDLILLIGYMRILTAGFVTEWANKILNIHPSLLPAFAGKMDLDVHRAVLQASVQETGCTVHYVTADVDAGPILLQKKCPVFSTDSPETLKARVQALEGQALVEAISNWRLS